MKKIPEIFGTMLFNDKAMKERLSLNVYKELKNVIKNRLELDKELADSVAIAMKEWAIEKGATHFTHWFQPMTGITAEKHDSFLFPLKHGEVIMEFSGKELIKGESDASSFPSGGLRATFEARGYTSWDPTSFAFVRGNTLYVPTAFCSYGGEALDKKTPLLRSMYELNRQTLRILRLFGDTQTEEVFPTVGAEQEYFLIDTDLYKKRKDLIFCGRTLLGAKAPKGQELEDHYFGEIKPRVATYMEDLDYELWKLGIYAKTEHGEVAPSQFELAPVFSTANVACDQNQIMMTVMKTVAKKHGLTCLLHEKPFDGVNGSGKHNNWSICTDSGENLFSPGKKPEKNLRFLLLVSAVIKAVDEYQGLLRASVATAGNDCRLGANEAPPSVMSVFLGEQLTNILYSVGKGDMCLKSDNININDDETVLPTFKQDSTDRNRTSPFAFTGNKFEFRMLGSSLSITCPTLVLNTIVADALCDIADELEKAKDIKKATENIISSVMRDHGRIVFNGNNYSEDWIEEAQKRGLLNLKETPDSMERYVSKKNIDMFERRGVLTEGELRARYEIITDNYCKVVNIEALTIIAMIKNDILPATMRYIKELTDTLKNKEALSISISCDTEREIIKDISALEDDLYNKVIALQKQTENIAQNDNNAENAKFYKDIIRPMVDEIRAISDKLEEYIPSDLWPYPTYSELLFSI